MMTEDQFRQIMGKAHADVMSKHADVAIINWLSNDSTAPDYDAIPDHTQTMLRAVCIVGMQHALEQPAVISDELFIEAKDKGVTPEDIEKYMNVKVERDLWDKL